MRGVVSLFLAIGLVASSSLAEVTLHLQDGQILEGDAIKKEGELYLLELETGDVLPVPVELVADIELTGDDAPVPTGLTPGKPETLVGPESAAKLPTYDDQRGVLRDSESVFRKPIIDPTWVPTSDWSNDLSQNDFNPSRWYRAPIDPTWVPVSGLREDVTHFNPARWYQPPIDPTWWPKDGFGWMEDD